MPTSRPPHPPTTSTQTSYGVLSHSHKHISIAIYPSLSSSAPHSLQEKHFEQSHHPCLNPICQACKFVMFGSQIDLQAHMVEEHGTEMSLRDKKDTRCVNAAFEFTSSSSNVHHGGGPGGDSGDGSGAGASQVTNRWSKNKVTSPTSTTSSSASMRSNTWSSPSPRCSAHVVSQPLSFSPRCQLFQSSSPHPSFPPYLCIVLCTGR